MIKMDGIACAEMGAGAGIKWKNGAGLSCLVAPAPALARQSMVRYSAVPLFDLSIFLCASHSMLSPCHSCRSI